MVHTSRSVQVITMSQKRSIWGQRSKTWPNANNMHMNLFEIWIWIEWCARSYFGSYFEVKILITLISWSFTVINNPSSRKFRNDFQSPMVISEYQSEDSYQIKQSQRDGGHGLNKFIVDCSNYECLYFWSRKIEEKNIFLFFKVVT